MKVLLICGSPRNGNTQAMLEKVAEGAKEGGAETEMVLLRKLDIKHCIGCKSETGECSIPDDMQKLYPKLLEADVLVFGTPAYYDNVTGIFKDFMDRTNIFYKEKKWEGKPFAILTVGGMEIGEGSIERCEEIMKNFTALHRMKLMGSVLASAFKAREIEKDEGKMKECMELGKKLANL